MLTCTGHCRWVWFLPKIVFFTQARCGCFIKCVAVRGTFAAGWTVGWSFEEPRSAYCEKKNHRLSSSIIKLVSSHFLLKKTSLSSAIKQTNTHELFSLHILKQSMPLTDSAYLNICMKRECEFLDYFFPLASAIAGYLFSLLNALELTSSGLCFRKHYCDFFFLLLVLGKQVKYIPWFLFKMFYTQKSMSQQTNSNTVVEGISRSTSLRHCDKATSLGSFPPQTSDEF